MKKTPTSLLALGATPPPQRVSVAGGEYRFVRFFKHDFFAGTALYESAAGKVVVKFGRQAPILGFPGTWIGKLLAGHEARLYQLVGDLDAVPTFLGRVGPTGIAHVYVEGGPLDRDRRVPDDFFDRLRSVIAAVHERRMAYVDLEKRQNVLVGSDGRPYLIDFQISWHVPRAWGGELFPARWIRRRLQEADRYHLLKLQRRVRRDQLSAAQIEASYRRPFHVNVHRWLTRPLLRMRRAVLDRIDPRRGDGERGTVQR